MNGNLSTSISIPRFPTGRIIWIHDRLRERCAPLASSELEQHLAVAIGHGDETLGLEARWRQTLATAEPRPTAAADHALDRAVATFIDSVKAWASLPAESDPGKSARALLACFPGGAQAITHRTHIEECEIVTRLVKEIQTTHAKDVARLGVQPLFDQVVTANDGLRAALASPRPAGINYDQVRAAQHRHQQLLLKTVAMILGLVPGIEERDEQNRAALLQPLIEQCEQVAAYRRSRRAVRDVDPKTGTEIPVPPAVEGTIID